MTALQAHPAQRRDGRGIHADWENSGVENLIQMLRDDMNASKQAKLDRLNKQLEEAKLCRTATRPNSCGTGCASESGRRRTAPICP